MTRVKEALPEPNTIKVQDFDADAFLASIHLPPYPETEAKTQCRRCFTDMTFGSIRHEDGSQWDYCRCPMTQFGTKCYVTCGKEDLVHYLRAVKEQTHPCYAKIAPEKFKCACEMSTVLAMSKSKKNPGRLYFKCPRKSCKLFQWLNESPKGLALLLLSQ